MQYSGLELVAKENYFTFASLESAPDFSLAGLDLLGIPAVQTFAGKPWEVFEANSFVYDFDADLMKPIASIVQTTKIEASGSFYVSKGLIQAGSFIGPAQKVKNFDAWFSFDRLTFRYSGVEIV